MQSDKKPNDNDVKKTPIGMVLRNFSGFFYVQDEVGQVFECKLRGKIKDRILSGDRVEFTKNKDGYGIIERLLPRTNMLYRPRVANISLVLIVLSCNTPSPDFMLLDRLLFLAAFNKLTPCIILNKADLDPDENARLIKNYYPAAGFKIITTSVKTQEGIEELKTFIKNEVAVFAGPSGVGKTSLLNNIISGTKMPTQEVSKKIGRGRHTTRHVELYPVAGGGWIVDTPGFSVLDMPALKRQELAHYFPDFRQYESNCRFADCIHFKEKECGVIQAVRDQLIFLPRYRNYINMLEEIIQKERCY